MIREINGTANWEHLIAVTSGGDFEVKYIHDPGSSSTQGYIVVNKPYNELREYYFICSLFQNEHEFRKEYILMKYRYVSN